MTHSHATRSRSRVSSNRILREPVTRRPACIISVSPIITRSSEGDVALSIGLDTNPGAFSKRAGDVGGDEGVFLF